MRKYFLLILFIVFGASSLLGQSLQDAKQLYAEGKYAEALPIFENELKTKKNDASLNHWYGVCLYETSGDLDIAKTSLELAAKRKVYEANMYLGLIYTEKYDFEQASKYFDVYEKHLTRKGWRSNAVKEQEAIALEELEKNQKWMSQIRRMVSNTEDIQIIDSIVVDKRDFLDAYNLSFSGGRLASFGEVFKTNKPVDATIYFNEKETKMYYAMPDTADVYSLYSQEYLLDHFGNEKKLSKDDFGLIGSQNYPFVMPDGVTIYFAAEDEQGIGGYDLFVSRYNMNTDTYLRPERLNMPFNSIGNDYMMVVDEEKGIGWFATDRNTDEGYVCIYTFIPNSIVKIIQSEDNQYLANRARISSIKDTWAKDANYGNLITKARTKPVKKEKKHKDFDFVINDQTSYYVLADFKSKQARDTYYKVIQLKSELKALEQSLDQQRAKYMAAPEASKTSFTHTILSLEEKQRELYNTIAALEVDARNQEISQLKK